MGLIGNTGRPVARRQATNRPWLVSIATGIGASGSSPASTSSCWAEDHHDIALVDQDGTLLAKRRIGDDTAGFGALLQLLVEAGDHPDAPIPVAIETSRGLLVACLRATGRPVFPINPMSVSRYRDRHTVARRKSDAGDAFVLANILRTDLAAHRPLPADSELAQAIAVLARAQQDAVWRTTSCARCCASSTRPSWRPSPTSAADCSVPRPERCWPPHPPRTQRPG
jgi:hypothetical protein